MVCITVFNDLLQAVFIHILISINKEFLKIYNLKKLNLTDFIY